jgi:hypothetical protein
VTGAALRIKYFLCCASQQIWPLDFGFGSIAERLTSSSQTWLEELKRSESLAEALERAHTACVPSPSRPLFHMISILSSVDLAAVLEPIKAEPRLAGREKGRRRRGRATGWNGHLW